MAIVDVDSSKGLAVVKQEVARLLATRRQGPDLAQAKARLMQVEQAIVHLVEAIKQGIVTVSTKAELVKLEGEQHQLQERLQRTRSKADQVADFVPNLVGQFKAALEDLTTVTQYNIDRARASLQQLMGKEIVLHPTADGQERYLTAEVSGDYAGLYTLVTSKNKFGGGQRILPSLAHAISFNIQGVALAT